ncbi:hypothetical protein Drorol1_Dr00014556 [Drosera rotundifolia]
MDGCLLFRVFGPSPSLIPFSQQVIDLPDLPPDAIEGAKWRFYIDKFALSSSPSKDPEDYTVVVIYGGYRRLAVRRPGDHSWTKLPATKKFSDVIYLTGKFYGIRSYFQVETFSVCWDGRRKPFPAAFDFRDIFDFTMVAFVMVMGDDDDIEFGV